MDGDLERRLNEEIQEHLAALEADYLRAGMSPREARFAARHGFGGVEHMLPSQIRCVRCRAE